MQTWTGGLRRIYLFLDWKYENGSFGDGGSTGHVEVKAVQEIVSGMHYYGADKAMAVTNSYFTKPAMKMAEKCKVVL